MNDLENLEEDYKRFVLENKNIIVNVKNIHDDKRTSH